MEARYRTLAQIEKATIIEELLELDAELADLQQSQTAAIDPQLLERRLGK